VLQKQFYDILMLHLLNATREQPRYVIPPKMEDFNMSLVFISYSHVDSAAADAIADSDAEKTGYPFKNQSPVICSPDMRICLCNWNVPKSFIITLLGNIV